MKICLHGDPVIFEDLSVLLLGFRTKGVGLNPDIEKDLYKLNYVKKIVISRSPMTERCQ